MTQPTFFRLAIAPESVSGSRRPGGGPCLKMAGTVAYTWKGEQKSQPLREDGKTLITFDTGTTATVTTSAGSIAVNKDARVLIGDDDCKPLLYVAEEGKTNEPQAKDAFTSWGSFSQTRGTFTETAQQKVDEAADAAQAGVKKVPWWVWILVLIAVAVLIGASTTYYRVAYTT